MGILLPFLFPWQKPGASPDCRPDHQKHVSTYIDNFHYNHVYLNQKRVDYTLYLLTDLAVINHTDDKLQKPFPYEHQMMIQTQYLLYFLHKLNIRPKQ